MALLVGGAAAYAKDVLTIGVSQFPSSMHPNIDPEVIKSYTLSFALRPIAAFDKDGINTCMLCTALPTLQNGLVRIEDRAGGGKGMAVTVKLRDDILWGDGRPVTAADLAFTARVGRDPTSGFANTRVWGRVASVDVIDDHTAVLHLDEISTLYDRLPAILPEHLEGPVFARVAGTGDYRNQTTYNRAPTTPGLYNGPYLVTDYQPGQLVVLEPNPYWKGTKPGIRRIVLKAIGNTAALQANLLAGDVDMAPGDAPSLTIDQVLQLRKQQPDRFTYIFRPALTYEHIDLNLDNPILQDIRVRRALLLALDRNTLVERLFEGMQPVADSFVSPLDPMHADGVTSYPYDPARARALLAEAGWTPGPDGVCRNAAGARLSLSFGTTAGNRLRELQQQVLQNQWKNACIEVTIRNEPARTFFGETLKQRVFTGLAMYAWSFGISYPPRQTLATDQIPTAANNYGGTNYMDYRNPTMDAAILTAETNLDPAAQKVAWADIQRIYADDLPVLPLFFRADAYVLPKWLKGVTPTGHSDDSSLWSEFWRSE
ncbi:peptide ABC transporter substrate-binding protein [Limobrevibacterium gyesilva]|uniref:peptide ABC transporter substrate-binding protein n=1 Tax=Limobrevibacterium gyesilva TaxID=2991712 RepID=UPI002227F94D